MNAYLIYFIEVNLALAAFYLFYRLLLQKDTFFRQKRVAFLVTYAFALTFPLIDLSAWLRQRETIVTLIQTLDTTLSEIVITPEPSSPTMLHFLLWGYVLVAGLLVLRLLRQLYFLVRLVASGRREKHHGVEVITLPGDHAPFSFLRWVFVPTDSCSNRDLEEIIRHEQAHVHQHHSLDVLMAELVCIVCWFNPFAWLLKRSLRENLEYLADNEVIKAGYNPQSYQYHLLRLSSQERTLRMANHFNIKHLKNRIVMMNKQKTPLMGLTKYALSIPLFAFFLLAAQAWGKDSMNTVADTLVKASTQVQINGTDTQSMDIINVIVEEKPLLKAEVMPEFPGGVDALIEFFKENLRYPKEAAKAGIQGRSIIRFVIDSEGYVAEAEAIRPFNELCDAEAIRVVKAMPKWNPGYSEGKPVPVYFTVPITFRLESAPQTHVASNPQLEGSGDTPQQSNTDGGEKPLTMCDEMPQFPGGEGAMMTFINQHLKYPKEAAKAGIQGRSIIRFVVGKDGSITNVEAIRPFNELCDAEAIRVVKAMPKWTPGRNKGQAVPVYYTIPIVYSLLQ